jgi:hypothetical protein
MAWDTWVTHARTQIGVSHGIECTGHVRMAVVAADVVHALAVGSVGALHSLVPAHVLGTQRGQRNVPTVQQCSAYAKGIVRECAMDSR